MTGKPECEFYVENGVVACSHCHIPYKVAYPVTEDTDFSSLHRRCTSDAPRSRKPVDGPGTELHSIIQKAGYEISTFCKCKSMMKRMNAKGPDWCEEHAEAIITVMVDEAKRRKLKWPERVLRWQAGRWLRQAIHQWRKKSDSLVN